MIVASFQDNSLLPDISIPNQSSTDFTTDTVFSEAQKVPFSHEERKAISRAIEHAKSDIHEKFSTTETQQSEIEAKLDYLERKVNDLDKFNWKRLFVTTLVGISVDFGFGTLIPAPLLDVFKDVSSQFLEKLLKK